MSVKKCTIVIFFSIVQILTSCGGKETVKVRRKNVGGNIVEAVFIGDSIADGQAKYFNDKGNEVGFANFKYGLKNGVAINYFENGSIKDSMNYSCGLLTDMGFGYDSLGNLLYAKNYYYGVSVGPQFYYKQKFLYKYYFIDFNKNDIINCEYDSNGKPRLVNFSSKPILTEVFDQRRNPALEIFLYFPKPPGLLTISKIGLTNDRHEIINEAVINDNRLFLDTVVGYPEKGWHYFVSTEIRSLKDSINKTYITDLEGY